MLGLPSPTREGGRDQGERKGGTQIHRSLCWRENTKQWGIDAWTTLLKLDYVKCYQVPTEGGRACRCYFWTTSWMAHWLLINFMRAVFSLTSTSTFIHLNEYHKNKIITLTAPASLDSVSISGIYIEDRLLYIIICNHNCSKRPENLARVEPPIKGHFGGTASDLHTKDTLYHYIALIHFWPPKRGQPPSLSRRVLYWLCSALQNHQLHN